MKSNSFTLHVCDGPKTYDHHRALGHAVALVDDVIDGSNIDAGRIILAGNISPSQADEIRKRVDKAVHIIHEHHLADFNMERASMVAPRRPPWLWTGFIPRGMLTLWAGDPQAGKTFVALDIAARVTTGRPMPDGSEGVPPAGVLIVSYDDAPAETIVPRLIGAGADLDKVVVLDGNLGGRGESCRVFADDIEALLIRAHEQLAATRTRLGLVILDPMSALLAGADSHQASSVYLKLGQLVGHCNREDVAALVLAHTGKAERGKAINAATGSQAQAGIARAMAIFAQDGSNEDRLILPSKLSVGRMGEGHRFRIVDVPVTSLEHGDKTALAGLGFETLPRVDWLGGAGMDAQGWIDQQAAAESPTRGQDAIRVALTCIAQGTRAAMDIEAAAKAEGITKPTLQSATKNIGLVKVKTSFGWLWGWPTESADDIVAVHTGGKVSA